MGQTTCFPLLWLTTDYRKQFPYTVNLSTSCERTDLTLCSSLDVFGRIQLTTVHKIWFIYCGNRKLIKIELGFSNVVHFVSQPLSCDVTSSKQEIPTRWHQSTCITLRLSRPFHVYCTSRIQSVDLSKLLLPVLTIKSCNN